VAAPSSNFTVRLPGLDDTFHLVPDSALPQPERRARAQARAERLAASPTPEIVRGTQDILTRIDDVQDGLVTLSLITRFAAARNPILAPIAKVMAVGADVLNITQFMQTAGLIGAGYKGSMYRTLAASPRTYSQRLRRTLKTGNVNPGWGELLQVLQTTDQLFGVGLSLGAVVGAPIDTAFLALRGGTLEIPTETLLEFATLAPSFFAASPWVKAISLGAGFALSTLNTEDLPSLTIPIPGILPVLEEYLGTLSTPTPTVSSFDALETAEWILETSPLLDVLEQELSTEDHFAITMARYMALATLAPLTMAHPTGALIKEKIPLPIRARFPAEASTSSAIASSVPGPMIPPALPLPGNPVELTAGEIPAALRAAHAPGPLAWTLREPYHPLSIYASSLAGEAMNTVALMLEGPGSITRPIFLPEARAAAIAIETGRPIKPELLEEHPTQ
jgi:hypothetical protein